MEFRIVKFCTRQTKEGCKSHRTGLIGIPFLLGRSLRSFFSPSPFGLGWPLPGAAPSRPQIQTSELASATARAEHHIG